MAAVFPSAYDKIPVFERFAFIPWILFLYTYLVCTVYEDAHGTTKTPTRRARNYYLTLYAFGAVVLLHYAYVFYYIFTGIDLVLPPGGGGRGWLEQSIAFYNSTVTFRQFVPDFFHWAFYVPGLTVLTFGLYFAAMGRIHLDGYWKVHIAEYEPTESKLVTKGPYAKRRHPIYHGQNMMVFGTALCGFDGALLLMTLVVWAMNYYRARHEEDHLTKVFPQEYPEYARNTWAFNRFIY